MAAITGNRPRSSPWHKPRWDGVLNSYCGGGLERHGGGVIRDELELVSRELGLDDYALGELLGITREQLGVWRRDGVGVEAAERFEDVYLTVVLLARKLKVGRVQSVVRRPAPAWGGRTLLEMLSSDPGEAYRVVDEMFDPDRVFD